MDATPGALKGEKGEGDAWLSALAISSTCTAARSRFRQPEVVLGAWRVARASAPDMTEDEARLALERLDPLWDELFRPSRRRS
jgi:hypothetical protein